MGNSYNKFAKIISILVAILLIIGIVYWFTNTNNKIDTNNNEDFQIEKEDIVIAPDIKIIYPIGGENFKRGQDINITWWDEADAGDRSVYIKNQESGNISIIAESFMRSSGIDGNFSVDWVIDQNITPGFYTVVVCKTDINQCGIIDNYFAIN